MSDEIHFTTAIEAGRVHKKTRADNDGITYFETSNGRGQQLRRTAKRVEEAAKKSGITHPLLKAAFGQVVYALLDLADNKTTDDGARYWRFQMSAQQRQAFVHRALKASMRNPEHSTVPVQLVLEGVSIINQAVAERLSRTTPSTVPLHLLIPTKNANDDEQPNDTAANNEQQT